MVSGVVMVISSSEYVIWQVQELNNVRRASGGSTKKSGVASSGKRKVYPWRTNDVGLSQ